MVCGWLVLYIPCLLNVPCVFCLRYHGLDWVDVKPEGGGYHTSFFSLWVCCSGVSVKGLSWLVGAPPVDGEESFISEDMMIGVS